MGIGADELEEEAEHKEAATSQKNKRYAFVCTLWSTPLPQIFVDQCTFKRRDCTSQDYTRSWTPSPLWRPAVCKDTLLHCRPKHQAHTPHSYAFAYLGSCNCLYSYQIFVLSCCANSISIYDGKIETVDQENLPNSKIFYPTNKQNTDDINLLAKHRLMQNHDHDAP